MNKEIQDALEGITDAETKAVQIVKVAKDNLTQVVAKQYQGKEIILNTDVVAKEAAQAKGVAVRSYTKYQVTRVDGMYLSYFNRNGKPMSVHYSEATLA